MIRPSATASPKLRPNIAFLSEGKDAPANAAAGRYFTFFICPADDKGGGETFHARAARLPGVSRSRPSWQPSPLDLVARSQVDSSAHSLLKRLPAQRHRPWQLSPSCALAVEHADPAAAARVQHHHLLYRRAATTAFQPYAVAVRLRP